MNHLIDTHNHLFVPFFTQRLSSTVEKAVQSGVRQMLICAGDMDSARQCRSVAEQINAGYAAGLHPLYVNENSFDELLQLEAFLAENASTPHLCAVGEIGLDGSGQAASDLELQEKIFVAQLKLARRFELPASIHARGAVDMVCKWLRRIPITGGVVHAFNGSAEQAQAIIQQGFKLGFGGAVTYSGSKRIRKTAASLADEAWVLETDCPDMPSSARREENPADPHSYPEDIASYAAVLSELRNKNLDEIILQSQTNALSAFPKLGALGEIKFN